jgi:hypothetical protein
MSRSTKLGPGGNTIANGGKYNFNKYRGQHGIGATSISSYYALKRLASFCKSDCVNLQTLPKTIIQYNTSQGNSFIWDTQTFILDSSLPNFSYVASITSIPSTPIPFSNYLINVNIGNNVTTIGDYAFQNCSALTSLIIPNSVTSIGAIVFKSCTSLTSLTLPTNSSFTSISNYAFLDCNALTSLTIPNSVTTIGDAAFINCSALTSLIIPNAVITIGDGAFINCSELISITIPNSVTTIGINAFFNCSKLTTVYISQSKAQQLGNLLNKTWTSPGTVVSPDFYGAPLNVTFQL